MGCKKLDILREKFGTTSQISHVFFKNRIFLQPIFYKIYLKENFMKEYSQNS